MFLYRCTTQAEKYGYSVTFSGVGDPPPERSEVGHCSQTALFTRNHSAQEKPELDEDSSEPYTLVRMVWTIRVLSFSHGLAISPAVERSVASCKMQFFTFHLHDVCILQYLSNFSVPFLLVLD